MFEGATATGPLACRAADGSRDLTQAQLRAYQALLWMSLAEFDAPLPWTPLSLYSWFTSTVAGVRFRTNIPNSFCCEPRSVINVAVEATIPIPASSIPSSPLLVMVHKARHIEFGGHTCGFTQDQRVAELGSFGVVYELLTWIGMHQPSATPQERDWALNAAEWLRWSAFCQECPS